MIPSARQFQRGRTAFETRSGVHINLDAIDPARIRFEDMVFHLASQNRFNGAAGEWRITAHSCYCDDLLPPGTDPLTRLHVLLHDAHEYLIGDIVSPVAAALARIGGPAVDDAISRLKGNTQRDILLAMGISAPTAAHLNAIKEVDQAALFGEYCHFMVPCLDAWGHVPQPLVGPDCSDPVCKGRFSLRVKALCNAVGARPLDTFFSKPSRSRIDVEHSSC